MIDTRSARQLGDEGRRGGAAGGSCIAEDQQVLHVGDARRGQEVYEAEQYLGRRARIPERTVLGDCRGSKVRGDGSELVVMHERTGQC